MFQVSTYANKDGKAMTPPQDNRVRILMSVDEAAKLSAKDKGYIKDLLEAVSKVVPASS